MSDVNNSQEYNCGTKNHNRSWIMWFLTRPTISTISTIKDHKIGIQKSAPKKTNRDNPIFWGR